jgi:Ca2+-transporting ATPase
MHEKPRNLRDHIISLPAVLGFIGFGALSAGLGYINFLFFFVRNNSAIAGAHTNTSIYMRATVLTYVTIVLCQFVNLMLVRTDDQERVFSSYLWSNKKLLGAFVISFFCIFNIMYNPLVRPYFHTGPLSLGDWLWAILAAVICLAVRLLQRYSRKHSRKAVLELHQQVMAGAKN